MIITNMTCHSRLPYPIDIAFKARLRGMRVAGDSRVGTHHVALTLRIMSYYYLICIKYHSAGNRLDHVQMIKMEMTGGGYQTEDGGKIPVVDALKHLVER
jgi:uncharacterized protein (UPF0262 family)